MQNLARPAALLRQADIDLIEWARWTIVTSCALALICAGKPLPF